MLDRVPNPHPDTNYVARFTFPEFTVMCPVTGQPDFATLVIDYVPRGWLVESKSLKLYLNSFRNHGAFHEECTVAIGKKLVALLKPKWLRIGGYFHPRGGMPIDVFWQAGKLPARRLGARPGRQHLSRALDLMLVIAQRARSVAISAATSRAGSAARMTPPITATPAAPAATSSPSARRIDAADGQHRHARGAGNFGKTFAADLRAVARLARGLEGRTRQHIVDLRGIDRLGLRHGVDGHADNPVGTDQRAGAGGIAARGQMHAIGAGARGQRRVSHACISFAPFARAQRQQRARQQNLLVRRQVLFAQAYPAATGAQRRGDDVPERPPRLPAVGDEKERRIGKFHADDLGTSRLRTIDACGRVA